MSTNSSQERLKLHLQSHYQKEDETLRQLLKLEEMFREHHALTLREAKLQKELVDRLWVLTQRYIILASSAGCCKYPDVYAAPTEDILLHEYGEKLRQVRISNCRISESVRKVRLDCLKFEELYSKLDLSLETAFILGDTFHKPIAFYFELVDDLYKYMHTMSLKLKYLAHQLDPSDLISLEEYKTALEPSEDFDEYLTVGLTYCKHLRPKAACT